MKVLVLLTLICLESCWAGCPATSCEDEFDRNNCDESLVALEKVDTCYAAIEGHECECSEAELDDYFKWKEYVRAIYKDSYCLKAKGCLSEEASDCIKVYGDVDALFYTNSNGLDMSSADKAEFDDAITCVEKANAGLLNDEGCGWDVGKLKEDKTPYPFLWTAWLEGCEIRSIVKSCVTESEFTDILCDSSKLDTFIGCVVDQVKADSKCGSLPQNTADFKSQLFTKMVDQRCQVIDILATCQKKRSMLTPKDDVQAKLALLLEDLRNLV